MKTLVPPFPLSLIEGPDAIGSTLASLWPAYPDVQCCYVYGSAATGRLTVASDVDLAMAGHGPLSAETVHSLREDCAELLRRDVDLIDLHQATGVLLRNALRGVCIHAREGNTRYQLMRRLIYDQEDFHPLRRRIMEGRRRRFVYGH